MRGLAPLLGPCGGIRELGNDPISWLQGQLVRDVGLLQGLLPAHGHQREGGNVREEGRAPHHPSSLSQWAGILHSPAEVEQEGLVMHQSSLLFAPKKALVYTAVACLPP